MLTLQTHHSQHEFRYYNSDPMAKKTCEDMSPRVLPLNGRYVEYSSLPRGNMCAKRLLKYMADDGQLLCARILRAVGQLGVAITKHSMSWKDVLQMGEMLDDKKIKDLKGTFDFYDADHSGFIDAKELDVVFRKLGLDEVSHSTVCSLVNFFDTDDDSKLSEKEFLSMMAIVNDCVKHGKVRTKTKSGRDILDLEKQMKGLASCDDVRSK